MNKWWSIALAIVCLGIGWQVNGWRLNGKIDTLNADYAKANQAQEAQARQIEKNWGEKLSKVEQDAKTKNDTVVAARDAALLQLRNRPARRPTTSPANPAIANQCSGSSGAELSREDAEFLTREAARADGYANQVNLLIDTYQAIAK